jgi:hypothetical protein
MFKRREMRFNGEWSLLAGNRVYELIWNFNHETPYKFEIQSLIAFIFDSIQKCV